MIARKKSWLDSESDDHANFSCGESEMTLQQYTADQEMYAISKNKKKTTTTKKPTTISSTHHPLTWGNSLSVVEFLPGFLSHIIFNIFFPRNFQRWCLYCIYIIILDIKLFNILPSSTWCRGKYLHFMKNRIKWRETHFASLVPDAKYRYQNPPSAAYIKKKNAFLAIQSPLLYLETAHLLEKNTRNVF